MNCTQLFLAASIVFTFYSCAEQGKDVTVNVDETPTGKVAIIDSQTVKYASGKDSMLGFIAIDSSFKDKRPVVLIVPEWWGLGAYAKSRAVKLAEMGYVAMAVDFYGNQKYVDNPTEAQQLATPFYANPLLGKSRIEAALALIKMNPYADTNRIAAIGYCFGGAQVLNAARLGENLNGVVSFHGDLVGVTPTRLTTLAKILVCHGEADQFVDSTQVRIFKHQMDSVGANYSFKSYANATHAFTNPAATEMGIKNKMPIEYNAAADSASWQDMKKFFKEIF